MRKSAIILLVGAGLLAGPVLGQTSPSRPDAGGGADSRDRAPTGETIRRNGGSLLRASLAGMPSGTANARVFESASFFYVAPPEPKVMRKHDLVTIIIREESTARSDAKADLSRESEIDARLEEFVRIVLNNWEIEGGAIGGPVPSIKATGSREFQGDGKLNRTDSFIARIQAEVIDVKPNGTLVLQARKKIVNDDEQQTFILSGVCRAEDVTADNSVLSTQLYDLELAKSTKGAVRDATKRGAAHRFLDWLNPF